MAGTFPGSGLEDALTTGSADVGVVQAAYNLGTSFELRPWLYFDAVATVKPKRQAHPGSSVIFTITDNLAPATTALSEKTDIDAVVMSDAPVTVVLLEYGNAVRTSAVLRGENLLGNYDPVVANVIGFNAGQSLNHLARNGLFDGDGVATVDVGGKYAGVGNLDSAGGDLTSSRIRAAVVNLKDANVRPFSGNAFVGFFKPTALLPLREETGEVGWRAPQIYGGNATPIINGEYGMYEGVRFVETSECPTVFNAAGNYGAIVGAEVLAKAASYTDGNGMMPNIVQGPVTDTLRRFVPIGWHWIGGYETFRPTAGVLIGTETLA